MPFTYEELEELPFSGGRYVKTPKFTEAITFTLAKDPSKKVTLFTTYDPKDIPLGLNQVLHDELNYVIEEGKTYPFADQLNYEEYLKFQYVHYGVCLVEGEFKSSTDPEIYGKPKEFWEKIYLGHFFIKPNYVGRCSHACNAGFVVNHKKRGLGLGTELGKQYLRIAAKLGYVYSVFNLVFETNVASVKIWDNLGFERIGYVKNVACIKGETKLVGAHMFGKQLQEEVKSLRGS